MKAFAAFIGRSPDTATAEDLRRFQLHQTQAGMRPPGINSSVSALRFFFTVTLDRPDLSRRLTIIHQPRKLLGSSWTARSAASLDKAFVPFGFGAEAREKAAGMGRVRPRRGQARDPVPPRG